MRVVKNKILRSLHLWDNTNLPHIPQIWFIKWLTTTDWANCNIHTSICKFYSDKEYFSILVIPVAQWRQHEFKVGGGTSLVSRLSACLTEAKWWRLIAEWKRLEAERRATNIGLLYPKVRNNIGGDIPVDVPPQPKYWGDVSPASPAGLTPVL